MVRTSSGSLAASRLRRLVPPPSRALAVSAGLWLWAMVWFVANLGSPVGPLALLWVAAPLQAVVLTAVYWRTGGAARLPRPTRRFWRTLAIAAPLVGLAETAQGYDGVVHVAAGGQHTPPLMMALNGAAVAVILYALHRLPLYAKTRSEWLRIGLDGGTVMLATALFIWHFYTMPLLEAEHDATGALVGTAFVQVLGIVAVSAVAKVVLSSYAYIDRRALRLFAFAILFGCLGTLAQPLLQEKPWLLAAQVVIPGVLFFATWAGEQQRTAGPPAPVTGADAEQRPFSVLPYLAVAAVDGLLLLVNWVQHTDQAIVGLGAVLCTGAVVVRQITAFQDNRRLLRRVHHGARHDPLTHLPNRVLFTERLHRALRNPPEHPLGVVLIDLDDFKAVNDTLGHETGDALLVEVAARLAACVGEQDTVARLGGDEFVVVLDGADRARVDAVVERAHAALCRPILAQGHELLARASIGVADGRGGDDGTELLRRADIAMYAAKTGGGSRHLRHHPHMSAPLAGTARLGAELREAVDGGQMTLLYQPIVALDDGTLTAVEALLRWNHPTRGQLPPGEFIPVAERSGLIVPLGRWIVEEACRQIAAWDSRHGDAAPAVVYVNVSARELREPGFTAQVAGALGTHGIRPGRLGIELTETTALEAGASVAHLRDLRDLGVRVSLDDFGTGHSTLTLLHRCPVDELKLDRSFTRARDDEPAIAAAVVALAQALGLDVVAEGVETPQQAERLLRLGYQAAQGHHFAPPMPAGRISAAIAGRRTAARRADAAAA